jgi:hypothetical protein
LTPWAPWAREPIGPNPLRRFQSVKLQLQPSIGTITVENAAQRRAHDRWDVTVRQSAPRAIFRTAASCGSHDAVGVQAKERASGGIRSARIA